MPMVAPSRSPTATWPRSDQRPSRTRSVRGPNRLTRCRARARTPSATARVPPPGVMTTVIPLALAASRSTRSTPTPVRATTRSRGARSKSSASTTASARAMAPTATARSAAFGSATNETPSPRTPATSAGSTGPRATTTGRSAAIVRQLQLCCGSGEGRGGGLADGEAPEILGEDLDTPGPGPAGGAKRPDAPSQVEGALSAQAPAVGGVLEQRAYLVGVGVAELDAHDATKRDRRELGRRGLAPLGMPNVDDEAAGVMARVPHQPQAVVDRLDVRPGKELQPHPDPGSVGILGEAGELRHPAVVIPGLVGDVGPNLDLPSTEHFGRRQELAPDHVGPLPPWPVGPPVGEELQLQVDEAVIPEHRANPSHAVVALGHEQVGVDQPEPTKPRCGCGLDPLLQRDRALLVAAQRRRVTRGRPTSRQQILLMRQLVHAGQLRRAAVVPATAGTLCQLPSAAERSAAATTSAADRASSTEQLRRSPPVTARRNFLASMTLRSS